MMISIIAAIGKNNELGKNNKLLWKLPADMKRFREITSGHTVIMGRKTFESIGKPLPDRRNIIITRNENYLRDSVDVVHSLEEAIDRARIILAQILAQNSQEEEIFVVGGAEIYREAMPIADKLYITQIKAEDKGADSFFPKINMDEWRKTSHEEYSADEKNFFPYVFTIYRRK